MGTKIDDATKNKSSLNGRTSPLSSDSDDSWGELECEACNKTFTSSHAYEQHINSQKHHKQVVKSKVLAKNKEINKLLNPDASDHEDSEFAELHCKVCDMTFSGHKPYIAHTHGSVHQKNLKKQTLKEKMKDTPGLTIDEDKYEEDGFTLKPSARCTLCDKEFSGIESFQTHLDSKLHKKKLRDQKISDSYKKDQDKEDEEEDFYKKCEVCDKAFSGFQPYNQHMKSITHKKAMQRTQAIEELKALCSEDSTDSKLVCKECKKSFPDPASFKAHLENNSHEKYKTKDKILELVKTHPEMIAGKTIKNEFPDLDENDDFQIGNFLLVCKLCHTAFSGPENALEHLKSNKHLKVKEEKEKIKLYLKNRKAKASKENKVEEPVNDGSNIKTNSSLKNAPALNGKHEEQNDNDDFEIV